MGQYDYTGTTGASNYSGKNNEYRNGSNRDRMGSSYQAGYRGDNRTDSNRWSQDEGDEATGRSSYRSGSSDYGASRSDDAPYGRSYGSGQRYGSTGSYGTDEDYSTGTSYGRGNRYGSSTDSGSSYGSTSGSYGMGAGYTDYDDEDSETSYGRDDYRDGLAIDETRTLISSSKVEGTAVYDRDGSRMGTIHNFMVNKRSGRVDYAVLSFGGFLGMGTRYYPLPWQMLEYDTSQGGYVVDMDENDLEEAPSFRSGEEPDFSDRYGQQVYGYYGMRY